jgi:hypothetical protein
MKRAGFLVLRVTLFASCIAAFMALLIWPLYDWTTAWITFIATFVLLSVNFVVRLPPKQSRRYRWGSAGILLAEFAGAVVLALGIPDRAHSEMSALLLIPVANELWPVVAVRVRPIPERSRPVTERAKRVLFWLFGGPDVGWFESSKPDPAAVTGGEARPASPKRLR